MGVRFAEQLAVKRQHGLQAIAIEHLVARLAGGFLQPINSDSLKEAIGEAVALDLGELNEIKTLPGFPRAARATLEKAWAAGLKFNKLTNTTDALVRARIDAVTRLEARVLERLPPSMRRPARLGCPCTSAPTIREGSIRSNPRNWQNRNVAGMASITCGTEGRDGVQWVAGPRQVPAWVRSLGISVVGTAPESPEIKTESCASPRHEALEAMRWARALWLVGKPNQKRLRSPPHGRQSGTITFRP